MLARFPSVASLIVGAVAGAIAAGCGAGAQRRSTTAVPVSPMITHTELAHGPASGSIDIYCYDRPTDLSPVVPGDPAYAYVPNSMSTTVDVISQRAFKVVEHFPAGEVPQHVTPAYNLKALYLDNGLGNSLTPIDPRTGKPGTPIPVQLRIPTTSIAIGARRPTP